MEGKAFLMSCLRTESSPRDLLPRPRYPSMVRYPKGTARVSTVGEKDVEAPPEGRRTAMFSVFGMTCSACAGSVEKAIKRLPGIHNAAVDVLNNRAQVIFYPSLVSEDQIRETIEDAGFEAVRIQDDVKEISTLTCRLHIKGMTCTSCSSTVESALQSIPGIQKAVVALATEEAEIRYDPKIASAEQLIKGVEDIGFEAILITTGEDRNKIHLKIEGV